MGEGVSGSFKITTSNVDRRRPTLTGEYQRGKCWHDLIVVDGRQSGMGQEKNTREAPSMTPRPGKLTGKAAATLHIDRGSQWGATNHCLSTGEVSISPDRHQQYFHVTS